MSTERVGPLMGLERILADKLVLDPRGERSLPVRQGAPATELPRAPRELLRDE
jgi:hypothetical protein